MSEFKTEQEAFWAGDFCTEYMARNASAELHRSNVFFWRRVLQSLPRPGSIAELGCNIAMNLQALKEIDGRFDLTGFEINQLACEKARASGVAAIENRTIIEPLASEKTYDLTFTRGVLIHIQPESLTDVYDNLVRLSNKYVLVGEYYNPSPVTVNYRGHEDRLFKRDFAGELMDRHDLQLIDYGFVYCRDNYAPQDDVTWFLMAKR